MQRAGKCGCEFAFLGLAERAAHLFTHSVRHQPQCRDASPPLLEHGLKPGSRQHFLFPPSAPAGADHAEPSFCQYQHFARTRSIFHVPLQEQECRTHFRRTEYEDRPGTEAPTDERHQ